MLKFEFRVGGVYRFAYHVPGGSTVIVDEHAGIESEVTATITPYGGGAKLSIRHAKLARTDAIERHAGGWHGALDQLIALFNCRGAS